MNFPGGSICSSKRHEFSRRAYRKDMFFPGSSICSSNRPYLSHRTDTNFPRNPYLVLDEKKKSSQNNCYFCIIIYIQVFLIEGKSQYWCFLFFCQISVLFLIELFLIKKTCNMLNKNNLCPPGSIDFPQRQVILACLVQYYKVLGVQVQSSVQTAVMMLSNFLSRPKKY